MFYAKNKAEAIKLAKEFDEQSSKYWMIREKLKNNNVLTHRDLLDKYQAKNQSVSNPLAFFYDPDYLTTNPLTSTHGEYSGAIPEPAAEALKYLHSRGWFIIKQNAPNPAQYAYITGTSNKPLKLPNDLSKFPTPKPKREKKAAAKTAAKPAKKARGPRGPYKPSPKRGAQRIAAAIAEIGRLEGEIVELRARAAGLVA